MHPSFFTPRPPVAGRRPSSVGRRSTADPWVRAGFLSPQNDESQFVKRDGTGHENETKGAERNTHRESHDECVRKSDDPIGFFISRGYNMGSIRFDR